MSGPNVRVRVRVRMRVCMRVCGGWWGWARTEKNERGTVEDG